MSTQDPNDPQDSAKDASTPTRESMDSDSGLHAADEPTAMWDESALLDAGFGEVAAKPISIAPPATAPSVGGDDRSSVIVGNTGRHRAMARAPRQVSAGMSWGVTVGLAVAVGSAVYFLVRALKGG